MGAGKRGDLGIERTDGLPLAFQLKPDGPEMFGHGIVEWQRRKHGEEIAQLRLVFLDAPTFASAPP
jgi:hypothetical protein